MKNVVKYVFIPDDEYEYEDEDEDEYQYTEDDMVIGIIAVLLIIAATSIFLSLCS